MTITGDVAFRVSFAALSFLAKYLVTRGIVEREEFQTYMRESSTGLAADFQDREAVAIFLSELANAVKAPDGQVGRWLH